MKDKDFEFIKQKHKWRFVWTDIFDRYFILIAPLSLIFFSFTVSYFPIKRETDFSFFYVTIPAFLLGCLIFYLIFKRLESERQFKSIQFEKQNLEFENCFANLGWRLLSKTDKVIIAETQTSWFSWGETITLVLNNEELLFNSRPQGRQPFTFNRDKVNYKKLCNEIEKM